MSENNDKKEQELIPNSILKPMILLEPYYCYPKESNFLNVLNSQISDFVKTRESHVLLMKQFCKEINNRLEKIVKYAFASIINEIIEK